MIMGRILKLANGNYEVIEEQDISENETQYKVRKVEG
jgi:hypothetical protein